MNNKKKKDDTEVATPTPTINPLILKASEIIDKGVKDVIVIGVHENNFLEVGTTMANYSDVITTMHRSLFEITMNNIRDIVNEAKNVE